RRSARAVEPPPVCGEGGKRCFACLCEDVTVKDVHQSVAEGFDSLELSKRYTTVTMGPCQGRMCHLPSARLMARETAQSMAAVGACLDRLYPNRLSNLKPGRIRYGVICSDAGRILDDGTVCRLDDETFYVTTTSSGAGAVEEWFAWWLADWKLDVTMTDVTQGV